MASSSTDISSLTEDQQLALQQFTSVTDQQLEAAIPLLQKCQWNAQIAITRFFDGDSETVDPAAEASNIPPPTSRRTETLLDSIPDRLPPGFRRDGDEAPRVVATPESQLVRPAPLLLTLAFLPFQVTYNIFSRLFGAIGWAFPILPRLLHRLYPTQGARSRNADRRPLNPRDTAARFVREFEEEYSVEPGTVPFQECGYAQAFDAAKRDLKYLLVIMLSPEHDDTAPYVRETLLSSEVLDYIKAPANDIIVWGGSVQDSEAYQVANSLNVTKFPFAGLIVHTPSVSATSMSIVARIAGPVPANEFINKIRTAIQQRREELDRVRSTRREQQAARNIREEQNSAYERSLAQDRERARQRREAEAQKEKKEREERQRAEAAEQRARNLSQWRRWRAQSLPSEPAADAKDVVRISLRMPSGERVIRRFAEDADLEELYAYVECYDMFKDDARDSEKDVEEPAGYEHEFAFQLVSPMPREVYDLAKGGTLRNRIGRSGNLIVEPTVTDEEDEE